MRTKTIMLGGALLVVGTVSLLGVADRNSWPEAAATVIALDTQCEMKSTERGILSKTISTALIDCGDVETFKIVYPDQRWMVTEKYTARLRVRPQAGAVFSVELPIERSGGDLPAAGDQLVVFQNPKEPGEVKQAFEASGIGMSIAYVVVGAAVLAFGLRPRRRPASTQVAPIQAEAPRAVQPPVTYPPEPAPQAPTRTAYVPPPRQAAIVSGRRTFGKRGA